MENVQPAHQTNHFRLARMVDDDRRLDVRVRSGQTGAVRLAVAGSIAHVALAAADRATASFCD